MLDTKAIRPEIKGLFETIHQQAEKYAQAFELLDSHKQEYEKLSIELKTLNDGVYSSVNHELVNLKQKYDDIIKLLKIESSQIHQKYTELSDLSSLQSSYFSALESIKTIQLSLEEQFVMLKKGVDDYTESINSIKNSADEKVDDFLKDSLEEIEKTVKSQYQGFEDRITRQVRLIEGKILNNDEIYFAFQAKYKEDIKIINADIDDFKKSVVKLEIARNNPNDPLSFKSTLNELNSKIDQIEANIAISDKISTPKQNVRETISDKTSHSNTPKQTPNNDAFVNQLKSKIHIYEKKNSTLTIISLSAMITALIALALSLLI
jgi:hypothetical protein